MKTKELIEYLKEFPEESEVVMIAANPQKRKAYQGGVIAIADLEHPVFALEIETERDFDEDEVKAAEECERESEE